MKELIKALVAAKKQFKPIEKDKKGARSRYATLDSVYSSIDKALLDNGLVVTQPMSVVDGQHVLKTVVWHESGQSLESDYYPIASNADPQKVGAAITYGRRYQLCAMLGITADEDTDAEGIASGSTAVKATTRRPNPENLKKAQAASQDDSAKPINPDQVAEFNSVAAAHGWTADGIQSLIDSTPGIESVESIPRGRFQGALQALKNEELCKQHVG